MPSLEQQLYQAIVGSAAIQALLARDAGGNIAFYDKQIPQQNFANGIIAYPAGRYQRVASPRLFAHGAGSNQANVGRARFQITYFATTKNGTVVLDQIDQATLAVFRTFDAYNGPTSPAIQPQPGFFMYNSRTLIEPQTQPPLQKLEIDVTFNFSDHL